MTTPFRTRLFTPRISRTRGVAMATIVAMLVASLGTTSVLAQAPAAPGGAAAQASVAELEKLVARIALYPDDLVAIILPSSTNPLQIVQADRFLDKRKQDPKLPIDEKWDDAVKSLINYPDVIKAMSNDLDWTAALGEAVVADQGDVLEAVQAFRRKTQAVGNLKTDDKQVVVIEKEVIKIVPADPQVIYVPQYNPTTVVVYGGYSSYGYYPYGYPSYYYPYPPGAALATGLIWGAAIGAAWGGGHYGCHYGGGGNNNININRNTNINTGNINTGNINRGGSASTRPAGGSSGWSPNKQAGQVSRSVGKTPSTRQGGAGGGNFGASAGSYNRTAGASANAATSRSGGAGSGGGSNRSASAFSGSSSGRQASMSSSRGASSRSSMSSSGFSGGGSRGGGGRGGGGRSGGRR